VDDLHCGIQADILILMICNNSGRCDCTSPETVATHRSVNADIPRERRPMNLRTIQYGV